MDLTEKEVFNWHCPTSLLSGNILLKSYVIYDVNSIGILKTTLEQKSRSAHKMTQKTSHIEFQTFLEVRNAVGFPHALTKDKLMVYNNYSKIIIISNNNKVFAWHNWTFVYIYARKISTARELSWAPCLSVCFDCENSLWHALGSDTNGSNPDNLWELLKS